jgi:putative acetyltransferase
MGITRPPVTEPAIRPIRPADDPLIAAVIREVMSSFGVLGPGSSVNDAEVDAMCANYSQPRAAYFVVAHCDRVLGGGGIGPLAGAGTDVCELRKMYLLPELRGRGFGAHVLGRCLDAARERGYRRCYLETRAGMDAAQKLYVRSGFKALCGPLGATGHSACDRHFLLEL